MKRYVLHTPFNIYHFEATSWQHAIHTHTYFEIIFILNGDGTHHINGNTFPYVQGDVFLLGPEDFHYFTIHHPTEFCFIRFDEAIQTRRITDKGSWWPPIIETLLTTSSQSRGSIVLQKQEKQKLHALLAVLEEEYEHHQHTPHFTFIRDSLMRSILMILARNLFSQTSTQPVGSNSVEAILLYIRQHIHQPQKLSIEALANVFHYAPAYISIFFKKQTGEPLKQYIIRYRIKLIEARLLYSSFPLAQLADEFGYTDESHLCKQFKKYTGRTPISLRQANASISDLD